ncbi:MAG: hypothetical protein HY049_12195 [Acidobacteria bacterium]|nr:hypothetical protein [Acidobacteriota bacterium]
MRSPDEVILRVRSAYERGRILRALRTSVLVVPMVLASFGGCGRPATSIVIGVVLATVATCLVWRGGITGRAVWPGLVAGLAALVVPLVACKVLESYGIGGALPLAACVVGGLGSGLIVTRYAMRERDERALFVLVGGGTAALAGALGCLGAGFGGVIAMTAGLLAVTPLALRADIRRS